MGSWRNVRTALTILLTLLGFALLQSMLIATVYMYEHEAITVHFSQELVVGMAALLVGARLGLHRLWAGLAAVVWMLIVLFDMLRDIGAVSMGQDPLIYDAILLTAHLLVLVQDMLAIDSTKILLGVTGGLLLALGVTWGLLHWLMARHKQVPWWALGVSIGMMAGVTGLSMTEDSEIPSRVSVVDLAKNAKKSLTIWSRLQDGLSGDAYREAASMDLDKRPDVHIYIVESYGRIMNRAKVRDAWKDRLGKMGRAFRRDGWFMASGLSHAPVAGGRSWLADATLFSGIEVKYESVYRHLIPRAAEIPSLVRLFERNAYRTILVRPKDKARRGVKLVNHFNFEETVFFDDLEYSGKSYGWSGIPDQFTLGKLRDEVLPQDPERPQFMFFHMASSHIPWDEIPPVVDDWRTLDGKHGQGKTSAPQRYRTKAKEVEFQLSRYKRSEHVRINRLRATTQNLTQYAKAIDYDLEVLTQHVLALPERPSMIILMGDHQPPMMGKSSDFSVPVHVLTREPRLRRQFLEHGFEKGMLVQGSQPSLRHEGIFSVIARALAFNDRAPLPPYLPNGAVQGLSPAKKKSRIVTDKVRK